VVVVKVVVTDVSVTVVVNVGSRVNETTVCVVVSVMVVTGVLVTVNEKTAVELVKLVKTVMDSTVVVNVLVTKSVVVTVVKLVMLVVVKETTVTVTVSVSVKVVENTVAVAGLSVGHSVSVPVVAVVVAVVIAVLVPVVVTVTVVVDGVVVAVVLGTMQDEFGGGGGGAPHGHRFSVAGSAICVAFITGSIKSKPRRHQLTAIIIPKRIGLSIPCVLYLFSRLAQREFPLSNSMIGLANCYISNGSQVDNFEKAERTLHCIINFILGFLTAAGLLQAKPSYHYFGRKYSSFKRISDSEDYPSDIS